MNIYVGITRAKCVRPFFQQLARRKLSADEELGIRAKRATGRAANIICERQNQRNLKADSALRAN
jgi:hypothetical protein